MRTLLAAGCMAGIALIDAAAPAYADNTTHNNDCQRIEANGGGTPGNSATSPGSVFNEGGINSPLGGKGGQAYNNAGAPSQYDTGCAKTTANGTDTPMQTSMSPTQIKNNSITTRNATRVMSHTGKG